MVEVLITVEGVGVFFWVVVVTVEVRVVVASVVGVVGIDGEAKVVIWILSGLVDEFSGLVNLIGSSVVAAETPEAGLFGSSEILEGLTFTFVNFF